MKSDFDSNFKAGDRVEYSGEASYSEAWNIGQRGVVEGVTSRGLVRVNWDDKERSGPGEGAKYPANLRLISTPPAPLDAELQAISKIKDIMDGLVGYAARTRVLNYIGARCAN